MASFCVQSNLSQLSEHSHQSHPPSYLLTTLSLLHAHQFQPEPNTRVTPALCVYTRDKVRWPINLIICPSLGCGSNTEHPRASMWSQGEPPGDQTVQIWAMRWSISIIAINGWLILLLFSKSATETCCSNGPNKSSQVLRGNLFA